VAGSAEAFGDHLACRRSGARGGGRVRGIVTGRAAAIFVCIAAAALVPWRLHNVVASREDVRGVNPVETAAVSAIVARHARSGRFAGPAPAALFTSMRRQPSWRRHCARMSSPSLPCVSPEIITALREAIATTEARRATYLDHVPVDRWMELIITPVPVPTLFGGTVNCMLMTFHDQTPLRRVEKCAPISWPMPVMNAYAFGGVVRLHRYAAGAGQGRCQGARSAFSASCISRRRGWRG